MTDKNINWDATAFFASLTETNKFAKAHDFVFAKVSGLDGFEEALQQLQSATAIIAVSDISQGYIEMNNSPHTRRVKTVFLAMRHAIDDMAARQLCMDTTLEGAYRDMGAWLDTVSHDDLPTAFFAENDVLAVGAMRALSEHGIRVPEDVSMIGFDDLSVGAFSNPPLTTVHVPKHEVGEIAVRRLVGNIRNPKSYTCKTAVSTYFVERQSVREL